MDALSVLYQTSILSRNISNVLDLIPTVKKNKTYIILRCMNSQYFTKFLFIQKGFQCFRVDSKFDNY